MDGSTLIYMRVVLRLCVCLQCAQLAEITNFNEIEACYNSVEGQQLLHDVGLIQETLDPQIYYVPWILINDVSRLSCVHRNTVVRTLVQ